MLSAARKGSSRSVLTGPGNAAQSCLHSVPSFPAGLRNDIRAQSTARARKNNTYEDLAYQSAKKIADQVARGPRTGVIKKLSRGLKEKKEMRDTVLGAVAARPSFRSKAGAVFTTTEARAEDLEAPGDGEGGIDLIPELRLEPGSFVELRRNGHARWGVVLGYELHYDGTEIIKTMLSTGEAVKHPPRDMQFSVARFASPELAMRAGEGTYADENNPIETQSRIALGKMLRSLDGRIEQASRTIQHAANRLYEYARHSDGKTWSKVTLADAVALIAGERAPTLELTYALHQHFMETPLKYIADTFEHRLSNIFAVRPLRDVERMERVTNWVRNNNPAIDEFAAKARIIIDANTAQKRESMHEDPTWAKTRQSLPELNEADRDILNFIRDFLRQRRELQENPCLLILPLILSKISPSYLPLVGHSAFRVLEDLSVLAPWSNHVIQDIDLQLHEFTDTLDTPLPGTDDAPVAPVVINDNRIYSTKTIDGLDNMRHDFGNLAVYVIDDSTAEELDDGISIERTTDGSDNVWLHIHIADPTSVLRHDDPLAVSASCRGATAYFPDCTYPMLPSAGLSLDALSGSSGDASINVLSFSALVSPTGDMLKHNIRPGLVRRVHVMRYDDVTRALGASTIDPIWPFGRPTLPSVQPAAVASEALPDLKLLHRVTSQLAKRRVSKTDSVLWSQPRAEISMKKAKLLTDHDPRPIPRMYRGFPQIDYSVQLGTLKNVNHALDASRLLVAECAITAGRIASLFAQEHGIPMVYRSLARPTGIGADKYQPLMEGRDPYQGTVLYRDALVQQLVQVTALPMLTPGVHWQLGISAEEGYVRATSPLRRYLDMLCHWQIKSALHPKSMGVKPPFSMDDLKLIMVRQHLREQARRRAGTTSIRLWAMRYIQNRITSGGHDALKSLEAIIINRPVNTAHSLEQVIPVMIPYLGMPATVYGCDVGNAPPIGSTINTEIANIELGYNPRLVVRLKGS